MRYAPNHQRPRRLALLAAAPMALALTLAACDDDDNDSRPTPTPTGTPTTTPSPSQASRNIDRCLSQVIVPATSTSTAVTVPSLILPDTLKLDFNRPNGFPNGRGFDDPVVDLTLAALLLDLTRQGQTAETLVGILNPPRGTGNATSSVFPFIGPATGGQPQPGTATTFNFRTDPASAYVRVDRMGNPAVATALIGSPNKNYFNDSNPTDDEAGAFVNEAVTQLTGLHNALADDVMAAGLTPCSTPG